MQHHFSRPSRPRLPSPFTFKPKSRIQLVTKSSPIVNALVQSSYIVGNGIIMFTFIYTTLNWAFYKTIREKQSEAEKAKREELVEQAKQSKAEQAEQAKKAERTKQSEVEKSKRNE